MVSIKDVVKAINKRLKESFPDITIQSKDVKEGYTRPCFYTEVTDYNTEQLMTSYDRKSAVISIYYFPSDPVNNQIELLDVREKLQGAFIGTLEVNEDFIVHLLDIEDDINDGVLNVDIEIEYYIRRAEKEYPIISDIEINNI